MATLAEIKGDVLAKFDEFEDVATAPLKDELAAANDTIAARTVERDQAREEADAVRAALQECQDSKPSPTPVGIDTSKVAIRLLPHFKGTPDADIGLVKEMLDMTGFKVVSCLWPQQAAARSICAALAEDGIDFWLTVGVAQDGLMTDDQWARYEEDLGPNGLFRGRVRKACGWNEPQHDRNGTTYSVGSARYKETIAHSIALDSHTPGGVMTGTPPLWDGNTASHKAWADALTPAISAYVDEFTWHHYRFGDGKPSTDVTQRVYTPSNGVDDKIAQFRNAAQVPTMPGWCHETGFSTATPPTTTPNAWWWTESEQAAMVPATIMAHLQRDMGIAVFQMSDPFLEDLDAQNRQDGFGLFRPTKAGSIGAKPVVAEVARLLGGSAT